LELSFERRSTRAGLVKLPDISNVYYAMPTPTCGRFPAFLALGVLLALGGCASEEHAPEWRDAADAKHQPPTPIAGHEDFFDGKIGVDLHIGALDLGAAKEAAGVENKNSGAGGGGGGRHRGGGTSGGLGMGGGYGGGGGGGRHQGGSEGESGGSDRPADVRPMMGSMGPAEMIHLQFTNHGSERVVLNIVDFVSPLGNFAVQPEKLTLEPGQSVEVEPMSSRLGGSVTEVEATLVLHLAGKTEKKVIVLRAVPLPGDQPGQTPAGQQAETVPPAPGK
jgi:hypothetical protein